MVPVFQGDKRTIYTAVRMRRGSGAIALTNPERKIVDASGNVITGFDWAAATWDSTLNQLSAVFDSTLSGLIVVGKYFMLLRGVIGPERYTIPVEVDVINVS